MKIFMLILLVVAVVICGYAYFTVILHHTNVANTAQSKPATLSVTSGWQWIVTKVDGWKTTFLAWITALAGAFAAIPDEAINQWTGLPWASVVDQKTAAFISIVCGIMIPITHSMGIAKAALTPPAETKE